MRPTTRQCEGIAGTITASGGGGTKGNGFVAASALAATKLADSMVTPRAGSPIAAAAIGGGGMAVVHAAMAMRAPKASDDRVQMPADTWSWPMSMSPLALVESV